MAQIVPGTTKSLLFYVIIQINCFIITSYSLKNLQEPGLKIHKSHGQSWENALNVSKPGVNRATWKSSDPTTVS